LKRERALPSDERKRLRLSVQLSTLVRLLLKE
jgi:hypothetical protein